MSYLIEMTAAVNELIDAVKSGKDGDAEYKAIMATFNDAIAEAKNDSE